MVPLAMSFGRVRTCAATSAKCRYCSSCDRSSRRKTLKRGRRGGLFSILLQISWIGCIVEVMQHAILGAVVTLIAVVSVWFFTHEAEAPTETGEDSNEQVGEIQSEVTETVSSEVTPSNVTIEIYDGISYPENILSVNLAGRGLSGSLKAEVRMLSNLRELDLSNNNFTGLPAEVGQLSKLEALNLSNNPFTGLPHELGNLPNLRVLDLRGTNYSEFDLAEIQKKLPASTEVLVD